LSEDEDSISSNSRRQNETNNQAQVSPPRLLENNIEVLPAVANQQLVGAPPPPPPPPPPPIPPRPKLWRFPGAEFGNKGVRR
jgi:hypothetical protein